MPSDKLYKRVSGRISLRATSTTRETKVSAKSRVNVFLEHMPFPPSHSCWKKPIKSYNETEGEENGFVFGLVKQEAFNWIHFQYIRVMASRMLFRAPCACTRRLKSHEDTERPWVFWVAIRIRAVVAAIDSIKLNGYLLSSKGPAKCMRLPCKVDKCEGG